MDQDQPAAPPGLWVTPAGSLMVFHFEISEEPTTSLWKRSREESRPPHPALKQSRRKGEEDCFQNSNTSTSTIIIITTWESLHPPRVLLLAHTSPWSFYLGWLAPSWCTTATRVAGWVGGRQDSQIQITSLQTRTGEPDTPGSSSSSAAAGIRGFQRSCWVEEGGGGVLRSFSPLSRAPLIRSQCRTSNVCWTTWH